MRKKMKKEKQIRWSNGAKPLADQDYRATLEDEERAWLDRFNREYYNGEPRRYDRKALHKGQEARRDCYNRSNAMRRDIWNTARSQALGGGKNSGSAADMFNQFHAYEDALIELIDAE